MIIEFVKRHGPTLSNLGIARGGTVSDGTGTETTCCSGTDSDDTPLAEMDNSTVWSFSEDIVSGFCDDEAEGTESRISIIPSEISSQGCGFCSVD